MRSSLSTTSRSGGSMRRRACATLAGVLALSVTACYQGFNVRGGAKEVGRATTRAVVTGSVSILVLDYFLINILSAIWPFLK